ncbi:MAG: hypothetical protein JXB00_04560 [Bacteroidales bacterium]|nr:hypothetical protein [Bacteroidales bacterium]
MKILITLVFLVIITLGHAQNGLEEVIVEKYYVSDINDSVGSSGILPVGSVTYRIFIDMLPKWGLQAVYGNELNRLFISTSTFFFNHPVYGKIDSRNISQEDVVKNTVMLDSWLSMGAACAGMIGVFKEEDDGIKTFKNIDNLLQNKDTTALGIPLTIQDGMLPGVSYPPLIIGFDPGIFDNGNIAGNSVETFDGTWNISAHAMGADTISNKVLIAQITTNGVFHFEINVAIGGYMSKSEKIAHELYVHSNPTGNEQTLPGLIRTLGTRPTVRIISPGVTSINTGDEISIVADARTDTADKWGTIMSVEFFVNMVSVGVDSSEPYSVAYTAHTSGVNIITTKVKDSHGSENISKPLTIIANNVSAIDFNNVGMNCDFYPNPVNEDIYIKFNSKQTGIIQAMIYDLEGRLIQSFPDLKLIGDNLSLHLKLQNTLFDKQNYILDISGNQSHFVFLFNKE